MRSASRIHLVGAERHPPDDRPPLSKGVLTGAVAVTALHPAEARVEIAGGRQIDADRVLLCTGGRALGLHVPGAGLPGVPSLRTVDAATAIRDRMGVGVRVVVVGGGFIGAEVAAAARTRGRGHRDPRRYDRP